MADIQSRSFSKNYSGLIYQSAIALSLGVICISAHEVMKRRRRGRARRGDGLGSVETWEFGYLYQGRSWAKNPSPPHPRGWPLLWVPQVINFPEDKFRDLRGLDATLYIRFMRGCAWFAVLHSLTTTAILLPIHVHFSPSSVSHLSMTRASITSLVSTDQGKSLLWIHIILLFWITITWILMLIWICRGVFDYRHARIEALATQLSTAGTTSISDGNAAGDKPNQYHPHPHPQFPFHSLPANPAEDEDITRGLRLRTVMVTNIPQHLRSEKDLGDYFTYYLSRDVDKPAVPFVTTGTVQPGMINKFAAFLFNRAKRLPIAHMMGGRTSDDGVLEERGEHGRAPVIVERVVIARKMTELASLLERREDVLKRLETAHIKLARKVLTAVKHAMDRQERQRVSASRPGMKRFTSKIALDILPKRMVAPEITEEREAGGAANVGETKRGVEEKDASGDMDLLIRELRPFVEEFGVQNLLDTTPTARVIRTLKSSFRRVMGRTDEDEDRPFQSLPSETDRRTIWDVLYSLPRQSLDPYQPLVHLQALFRNSTVPSIDYYTAKLGLLTQLITDARSRKVADYPPVSTAFVTFGDPKTARRACKYLAVHPSNPLACLVTPAPEYEDLDWTRIMKSTYRVELLKDWVVNTAVWAFTIFWVFPVSAFVALVSISNISSIWPALSNYLEAHPWEEELIQSLLPTILVALLSLLIPLLLLLIAKKAHTIITLSAIHDQIMTRYYKFLIVNVLVFFCVGTAALQSVLLGISTLTSSDSNNNVLQIVSDSFPTAGPFYVGWMIFQTGMHGAIELVLFGLPLFVYPSTKRAVTPRRRAVGIRPRTFNYYYWLPSHLLIIHVFFVFSVLNPLVIPFACVYFAVDSTVIRNQLLHVYAKIYEGNGQKLMIRMIRYSLDGLILAQAVFLAYMAVLKDKTNVALSAVLIVFTVFAKMTMTRICRAKYERDDIMEANVVCGTGRDPNDIDLSASHMTAEARRSTQGETEDLISSPSDSPETAHNADAKSNASSSNAWSTWRLSGKFDFSYANFPHRHHRKVRRQPNPFAVTDETAFSRLQSDEGHGDPSSSGGLVTGMAERRTDIVPTQMQGFSALQEQDMAEYTADPVSTGASDPTALVTRHPPHPAWNDDSDMNHPYDNPYYTRPVNNALWLPRDPCGLLDLDDTVDVKMSLTTLSSAGQLGVWVVPGGPQLTSAEKPSSEPNVDIGASPTSILSPQSAQENTYLTSSEALTPIIFAEPENHSQLFSTHSPYFTRRLDGSEEIVLPPAIASRVSAIDREEDVDFAISGTGKPRRPSLLSYGGRRRSSDRSVKASRKSSKDSASAFRQAGHSSFNVDIEQQRHQTTMSMSPRTRVTSMVSSTDRHTIGAPSSFLGNRQHRSDSLDQELAIRHSGFSEGMPLAGSRLRVGSLGYSVSETASTSQVPGPFGAIMRNNNSASTIPGPVGPIDAEQTVSRLQGGINNISGSGASPSSGLGASSSSRLGVIGSGNVSGSGTAHDRAVAAVTTQEVVQEEAIVEEQEAAEERARRERQEVEKESKQHRSWLTRWLFSNLEDVKDQ